VSITEGELPDAIDASPLCGPLPRPTREARAAREAARSAALGPPVGSE